MMIGYRPCDDCADNGREREKAGSTLGSLLRNARKRAGLTQTEAAHRMGYAHASTISGWETGAREPGLVALRAYARLLGTTAAALVEEWEARQ